MQVGEGWGPGLEAWRLAAAGPVLRRTLSHKGAASSQHLPPAACVPARLPACSASCLQAWRMLRRGSWTTQSEVSLLGGGRACYVIPASSTQPTPKHSSPCPNISAVATTTRLSHSTHTHVHLPTTTTTAATHTHTHTHTLTRACPAAYHAAGQWRMCFALASKAGWGAEARRRLAAELADELAAAGRAADAAQLTLEYLHNVDTAGGGLPVLLQCIAVTPLYWFDPA